MTDRPCIYNVKPTKDLYGFGKCSGPGIVWNDKGEYACGAHHINLTRGIRP